MLQLLCTFLLSLLLQTNAMAQPAPVSLSGDSDSCESYDDLGTLSFRFFNPAVRIEGRFLIISLDDSMYRCDQNADGSFTYSFERQTETSSLAAQYWTLFNITSWGASFIGGQIIRSASIEIPLKSLLSSDEWQSYRNGDQINKTLYLYLDSPIVNGLSDGHFDLSVGLHSGVASILSFQ